MFSQKVSQGLGEPALYRVVPHACVAGHPEYWYQSITKADANGDRGAAICMSQGTDRNWTEVIYEAVIATP